MRPPKPVNCAVVRARRYRHFGSFFGRPYVEGEARRRNRTDRAPNNDFAPRHCKWLRDCFDKVPAECLRLRLR